MLLVYGCSFAIDIVAYAPMELLHSVKKISQFNGRILRPIFLEGMVRRNTWRRWGFAPKTAFCKTIASNHLGLIGVASKLPHSGYNGVSVQLSGHEIPIGKLYKQVVMDRLQEQI
jgi:hypothetical protein